MRIFFLDRKLGKIVSSRKKIEQHFGKVMAKKIMQRLDDMSMAENLSVLMQLPGRHHPLTGKRKGQFACDLQHPYRLIYQPGNYPLPKDENGNLLYSEITILEIIKIEDYH